LESESESESEWEWEWKCESKSQSESERYITQAHKNSAWFIDFKDSPYRLRGCYAYDALAN